METVLDKAKKSDVRMDPFPHIIVRNAVSDDLAARLLETYPSMDTLTRGKVLNSNKRVSYGASEVMGNAGISDTWREFIEAHVSGEFFGKVAAFFSDASPAAFPSESFHVGVRKRDNFSKADVLLDAQICANTPVIGRPSSVRGPHVDMPNKLFAGLFYLRHPDDDSQGGELVLYRWRDGVRPQFYTKQYAPAHLVEQIATIPYESNMLVLFMNSPYSLHGVTPRHETKFPRLFVNILGEIEHPLFNLATLEESILTKIRRQLANFIPCQL